MVLFVPSSIGSISSSAPYSIGGATFARLASPGGRCLSYSIRQSFRVLPNEVLAYPRRNLLWRLLPFSRQDLQLGNLYV